MSTTAVDITILGRQFKVGSPSDEVNELHQTVEQLNTKLADLQTKTQIKNLEHLAVMVALNLCHELRQERNKNETYTNTVSDRINLLQETIEQALIDTSYSVESSELIETDNTVDNTTDNTTV